VTRYEGKPLKRLIECYVLWSIGRLPISQETALEKMAPRLRETYQAKGSWQEVIAQLLDFPPSMAQEIQILWNKNIEIAQTNEVNLSAKGLG
jgi:hypothetical protein